MKIAIVDYGVGNLFSLCSSFRAIGADTVVTGDAAALRCADKIVLPGVGAFADAAKKLRAGGLDQVLIGEANRDKPLLGICLGMQLLLQKSFEYGEHDGLGLISGNVAGIAPMVGDRKIPHIGWNALLFSTPKHPLFQNTKEGDCVYFVHSYAAVDCEQSIIARAEYGALLTAAVARDNVMGVQFHPEKSGEVGLNILRAFCAL
ncbi:MAG: imidazole glycerol phosphate synthase subunit HisH [Clostridia bacterium]|nr:imidazole glycerol phosphate synthase subunit HisH [Clostridia bacterium]